MHELTDCLCFQLIWSRYLLFLRFVYIFCDFIAIIFSVMALTSWHINVLDWIFSKFLYLQPRWWNIMMSILFCMISSLKITWLFAFMVAFRFSHIEYSSKLIAILQASYFYVLGPKAIKKCVLVDILVLFPLNKEIKSK